jgi:hypothetical protein
VAFLIYAGNRCHARVLSLIPLNFTASSAAAIMPLKSFIIFDENYLTFQDFNQCFLIIILSIKEISLVLLPFFPAILSLDKNVSSLRPRPLIKSLCIELFVIVETALTPLPRH